MNESSYARLIAPIVSLAVLAFCLPAIAQLGDDLRLYTTETLIVEYVGDNGGVNEGVYGDDDDFWAARNILNFQVNGREFDGGLRLDTALFFNPPQEVAATDFEWGPGSDNYTLLNYHNDNRVERIYGSVEVGRLRLTAGDFHVTFGRGMALSLVKLDDVGLDNALRGGQIEYSVPRTIKMTMLGGVVNTLNIDPLTRQVHEDDPLDRVFGGMVELTPGDTLALRMHGVIVRPRFTDESEVEPDRMYVDQGTGVAVYTVGGSVGARLANLQFYLECNYQTHDNYRPSEGLEDVSNEQGVAAFGEVIYDLDPVTLKGEGLYYRRWLMEGPYRGSATNIVATQPISYNQMVTLEPSWMPVKSLGNAEGGRLSGAVYLSSTDTEITISALLMKYEGGLLPQGDWTDHGDILAVHPDVEFRQYVGPGRMRVTAKGGYRHEWESVDFFEEGYLWHAALDLSIPMGGPHGLSLVGELRRHALELTEGGEPYWVSLSTLGYSRSGTWGVSLVHEYSDQAVPRGRSEMWGWRLPIPENHYLSLLASLQAPAPMEGLSVRLLLGTQRGGHKCAGGVCRDYPSSAGATLETVYRF